MTTPPQAPPPEIDEPSRTLGALQEAQRQSEKRADDFRSEVNHRFDRIEESQRELRQELRDGLHSTNSRIDQNQLENNRRFDALNQRMDQLQQRTDRIFYAILGAAAVLGGLLIANIFF